VPSTQEGPQKSLEREERVRLVHQGLRSLPPDLRQPIVLCDLQGLAYEEAANVLSIPLGTVKSRINRGREELSRLLLRAQQSARRGPARSPGRLGARR
jgi:RNA polymerase sigma-70 factor (ECF subfamily)